MVAVFRSMRDGRRRALRARTVRRLLRPSTAVADDSTTETYAALRLEIDNWRWAGVPFFIRTGQATCRPPRPNCGSSSTKFPRLAFAEGRPRPAKGRPARRQARPPHRHQAPAAGAARVTTWLPSRSTSTWSLRPRAARGPPVRSAAARGPERGQPALHEAGRRRAGLACASAAARRAATGPRIRAGLMGARGRERSRVRPGWLARTPGSRHERV